MTAIESLFLRVIALEKSHEKSKQDGRVKNNFRFSSAPSVSDDSSKGYSVGSVGITITTKLCYMCADATVGAAVWRLIS